MAAIDFPNAPRDGQLFVAPNGTTYQWVIARRLWIAVTLPDAFRGLRQSLLAQYNTVQSTNLVIPFDNTPPLVGEGALMMTANITPLRTESRIRATFEGRGYTDIATGTLIAALFKDGAANAVRACFVYAPGASQVHPLTMAYEFSPGTLAQIVFTVRFGPSAAGNAWVNAVAGAAILGGVVGQRLLLEELSP